MILPGGEQKSKQQQPRVPAPPTSPTGRRAGGRGSTPSQSRVSSTGVAAAEVEGVPLRRSGTTSAGSKLLSFGRSRMNVLKKLLPGNSAAAAGGSGGGSSPGGARGTAARTTRATVGRAAGGGGGGLGDSPAARGARTATAAGGGYSGTFDSAYSPLGGRGSTGAGAAGSSSAKYGAAPQAAAGAGGSSSTYYGSGSHHAAAAGHVAGAAAGRAGGHGGHVHGAAHVSPGAHASPVSGSGGSSPVDRFSRYPSGGRTPTSPGQVLMGHSAAARSFGVGGDSPGAAGGDPFELQPTRGPFAAAFDGTPVSTSSATSATSAAAGYDFTPGPAGRPASSARATPAGYYATPAAVASRAPRRSSAGPPASAAAAGLPAKGLSPSDFQLLKTLGTGSFGRVFLARRVGEAAGAAPLAVKRLKKSILVKQKQVDHIQSEKRVLTAVEHPFLVHMKATFKDDRFLYIVLEYVPGGEFFSHLRKCRRFENEPARFYAAQVSSIFEYLHSKNIVYRDLKPENILVGCDGYLKLTDFGFAKFIEYRSYTLCGTPEYIAPEVLLNKGHGKPVDWWTLGILIYEMLVGYPPFFDDEPMNIYQKILGGKIVFPRFFDKYAKALVKRLLTHDLSKRFGTLRDGAEDVKRHRWFEGLDWELLLRKRLPAPYRPTVRSLDDTSNFEDYEESTELPEPVTGPADPFNDW